jgi:hypothetical protein
MESVRIEVCRKKIHPKYGEAGIWGENRAEGS